MISLPESRLIFGDCLEVMPTLPAGSVQMVFADLPYSAQSRRQTSNDWDVAVPLDLLRQGLTQIGTKNTCWAMTATQPFSAHLVNSWITLFRYEVIFEKSTATLFQHAKRQPMRSHESVLIFYEKQPTYNPQMTTAEKGWSGGKDGTRHQSLYGMTRQRSEGGLERYPRSVLRVRSEAHASRVHPTQKPVALLEWLIRTYTNEGDTVLDPTAGSMTTAVAALRTGRNAICIEKDAEFFRIGSERVAAERERLMSGEVGHPPQKRDRNGHA